MATVLEEPLELETIYSEPPSAPCIPDCGADATTANLVLQAKLGNQEAWEILIRRYFGLVHETIRTRVKRNADVEEICQEVFLQALRKLFQLEIPEAFGGWLRRIAERISLNWLTRTHYQAGLTDSYLEQHRDFRGEPVAEAIRRESRQRVLEGLDHLRSMDRQALVAFYLEGKSLAEISQEFAVPLGTVKRRLHVARKRLARVLTGEQELSHPSAHVA